MAKRPKQPDVVTERTNQAIAKLKGYYDLGKRAQKLSSSSDANDDSLKTAVRRRTNSTKPRSILSMFCRSCNDCNRSWVPHATFGPTSGLDDRYPRLPSDHPPPVPAAQSAACRQFHRLVQTRSTFPSQSRLVSSLPNS